jgi:tetratricopeptide (TPR) repeat protein
MTKAIYDKASRSHTLIKTLGITLLAFFILVSIARAIPLADILNSGSNNVSNLNKSNEAIKAYDKAIGITPQDSAAWNNKGTLCKMIK